MDFVEEKGYRSNAVLGNQSSKGDQELKSSALQSLWSSEERHNQLLDNRNWIHVSLNYNLTSSNIFSLL